MDSLTRIISLMLLFSIGQFDDRFRVADGCRIKESSILLNIQKGDNIISKLMNRFLSKKTENDEKRIYPEVPSVLSPYYSMPAQEEPLQYYSLPYQPPVFYEETFVAPQQTYPSSQFWPVNVEKEVNIDKDVNIHKDVTIHKDVSSHKDEIPVQSPTHIHNKENGSPIYTTSILINNEPRQIVPPADGTKSGCNGNCHLHVTSSHHDVTHPINVQSNPPHTVPLPPVYKSPPPPVHTSPPTTYTTVHAPAPPVIPPTDRDSHFNVYIPRVPANQHQVFQLPPSIHDSRFIVDHPIISESRDTNRYSIHQSDLKPHHSIEHHNLAQNEQDHGYSYSSTHHHRINEASQPSNYPQTRYDNEPIRFELGLPNGQPTIIEREKTSTVIVETPPRSDIPDTSIQYAELPPRVEGGYRLIARPLVEPSPMHRAEFREKDQFSHSGTYMTHQERQVPKISYVDSSVAASTNNFEESKAKSSFIADRFRS